MTRFQPNSVGGSAQQKALRFSPWIRHNSRQRMFDGSAPLLLQEGRFLRETLIEANVLMSTPAATLPYDRMADIAMHRTDRSESINSCVR